MRHTERIQTRRHVVLFALLVLGVAWLAPLLGGSPSAPGPGFLLWGTAPMLVAGLLRLASHNWSDLGGKPAFRRNARWYLLLLLACPAVMVLTLLLGMLTSTSSVVGFSLGRYLSVVLPALVAFLIFAVFEEFGWRGYLVPKLNDLGINDYAASAIIAGIWATWHLPYLRELTWVYSTPNLGSFLPSFYLMLFAASILYNELRLITGSCWPAVLVHGLTNALQHPLAAEHLAITPGKEYLASFSGLYTIVLTGLLGIALRRWRLGKARHVDGGVQAATVSQRP